MQRFRISDIVFELQTKVPIVVTAPFEPFQTKELPDYIVRFRETEEIPEFSAVVRYHGDCFDVAFDGCEIRRFMDVSLGRNVYAVGKYDWEEKRAEIIYLPQGRTFLNETGNCFFHIAWEKLLLRENRMILHSCCISTEMGGILFSGRSGIGKSTQGELWRRYENAKLINGDRSILYKKDAVWRAYGSPYAGSSRCYVNDCTSIRAIVMLQQTEHCMIRRLNPAEAFHRIYAQLIINDWDTDFVGTICDLIEQLICDIPVYEMACTPDQDAVALLKETLKREE